MRHTRTIPIALAAVAPTTAFVHEDGPCRWHSDYWYFIDGSDVLASSLKHTVTPSGGVHVRAEFPATPLVCE